METKAVYNSITTIIDLILKAIQIKLAKKPVLQFLFNLTTKIRCFFYFIKSSIEQTFLKALLIWGSWLPRKIFDFFWIWLFKTSTNFFQMFGIHCSFVIQNLKITQNWMFPEKTFYNHDKLAFWFLFMKRCLQHWNNQMMMIA